MGKGKRTKAQRVENILCAKVNNMTNEQALLIELAAVKKCNEYMETIGQIIDSCYMKAMRDTRVGRERGQKIIDKANELIKLEAERVGK